VNRESRLPDAGANRRQGRARRGAPPPAGRADTTDRTVTLAEARGHPAFRSDILTKLGIDPPKKIIEFGPQDPSGTGVELRFPFAN
jgi:hypothetical protein